jgi:Domain of unknown function (DUF4331)
MTRTRKLATKLGAALLVAAALPLGSQVNAADHRDGSQATDDPLADLTDLYAWHTGRGTIVVVLGFNGVQDAGSAATYDSETLYSVHIDNTGDPVNRAMGMAGDNDNEADVSIQVKFGQNALEEWGVQVENLPGSDGTFNGPVETEIDGGGGSRAYAGVFEDPFFFDLEGFQMTAANLVDDADPEDLAFDSTRDFFAGTNINAVVLEFDAAAAIGGDTPNEASWIQIWATSGRLAR